jgi:hypothetical protein
MKYPKPSTIGRSLYDSSTGQFVVLDQGAAYADTDHIVLQHPDAFRSTPPVIRPGFGGHITPVSRRRASVRINDPYDDVV